MKTFKQFLSEQAGVDPRDFTHRFNTKLNPEDEDKFQAWAKKSNVGKNHSYNYDMRGAWKSGASSDERNHYPDTYKKPNHPTFSDQSQYHGEKYQGGKWSDIGKGKYQFTVGKDNMHSKKELQDYWNEVEARDGHKLVDLR